MKTKEVRSCGLSLAAGGLVFVSGCIVVPQDRYVEVSRAPVMVAEPVMVPASYVIVDGEYIGWVGDRYFYLGAGGVWLACGFIRLERFHNWERSHHDWREHAIRNDRFRRDAQGHEHPRSDDRHVQSSHSDPRVVQPGKGDPRVQSGQSDPRVHFGRGDSRIVQPGKIDPRVQPGRGDSRVVQPGGGASTKDATEKKGTAKDAY